MKKRRYNCFVNKKPFKKQQEQNEKQIVDSGFVKNMMSIEHVIGQI